MAVIEIRGQRLGQRRGEFVARIVVVRLRGADGQRFSPIGRPRGEPFDSLGEGALRLDMVDAAGGQHAPLTSAANEQRQPLAAEHAPPFVGDRVAERRQVRRRLEPPQQIDGLPLDRRGPGEPAQLGEGVKIGRRCGQRSGDVGQFLADRARSVGGQSELDDRGRFGGRGVHHRLPQRIAAAANFRVGEHCEGLSTSVGHRIRVGVRRGGVAGEEFRAAPRRHGSPNGDPNLRQRGSELADRGVVKLARARLASGGVVEPRKRLLKPFPAGWDLVEMGNGRHDEHSLRQW